MSHPLGIAVHGIIRNGAHGQDRLLVERVRDCVLLVAVADGVSSVGSDGTAQAVMEVVSSCWRADPEQDWSSYVTCLQTALNESGCSKGSGQTTLTVLWIEARSAEHAVANFVAIGDSPILLAHHDPITPDFPDTFLVYAVHSQPLRVQDSARIYSCVDRNLGRIVGRVAVGSFEIRNGDICLVCTDGVPIQGKWILDDLHLGEDSHRFFNTARSKGPGAANKWLFAAIEETGGFQDDATLITLFKGEIAEETMHLQLSSHDCGELDEFGGSIAPTEPLPGTIADAPTAPTADVPDTGLARDYSMPDDPVDQWPRE